MIGRITFFVKIQQLVFVRQKDGEDDRDYIVRV